MDDNMLLKSRLEGWFQSIEKAAIALSGGIDSSLVAFVARRQLGKENVIAVISASASVKMKELTYTRNFCEKFDIALIEIDANEIANPNYRKNPVNRCFFCKSALYSTLDKLVAAKYNGYKVLNGNNFSDMGDFRPGMKAADEYRVFSPLAECRFTKEDIRSLARFYGLPNWNKPASPCLSSRFPYGEAIAVNKLKMIEKAEDLLNEHGFDDVRVRYICNSARIEVPEHEIDRLKMILPSLEPSMLSVGFDACEIDPEGLVSGKLNRNIKGN